jgi:hypothetical protein
MKTIETTVYQFDELSDKAKEKAREWYREASAGDNSSSEGVIEDAETCAELIGITFRKRDVTLYGGGKRQESCVFWSGFSSQGDGACFEGEWSAASVKPGGIAKHVGDSDSCKELKRIASEFERIAAEFPQASFSVVHRGHYSHKYCTEFDCDPGCYEEHCAALPETQGPCEAWELRFEQAEKDLIEAARDFMEWIYGQLEAAYEYEQSDENVDETICANEYDFTADGERF